MDTLTQKATTSISIDASLLRQIEAEARADNQSLSAYLENMLYRIGYSTREEVHSPEFEQAFFEGLADVHAGRLSPNQEVLQGAEQLLQSDGI